MKRIVCGLLLLAAHDAFAGGVAQGCPQELELKFGYMSISNAVAHAGGGSRDKKTEHVCWVSKTSVTGQMKAESHGDHSDITSEYEYRISGGEVHASARLYGVLTHAKLGTAGGATAMWISWRDQVTFHSKQMPEGTRNMVYDPDPAKMILNLAKSALTIHGKLLQNPPPTCAGESGKFRYFSGIAALTRDALGAGVAIGSDPEPNGRDTFLLRIDRCGLGVPGGARDTTVVQNGVPIPIQVTVEITLLGELSHPHDPEGHLKVDFPSLRLCFVRPTRPSDLTMTSASGADYWCP